MIRKIYLLFILLFLGVMLVPAGFLLWACVTPFDKRGVVIFQYARLWAFCLIHMNLFWRVKISGIENVDITKSYIMMSNHQGMYDIPLLYYVPLHFKWVAKHEVLRMPIVGWVLWMQHGIAIRRGDPKSAQKMLHQGTQFLSRGTSIMIFPEGTRSKTGQVNKFMPGAFLMAVKAECPILPIVIEGAKDVVGKKGRGHQFFIKILPPISAQEVASSRAKDMALKLENIIRDAHRQMAPEYYQPNAQEQAEPTKQADK
ncbi:MAG: lysophospholipid acyltransferase family protein [Mucinivorans sp.]